MKVIIVRGRGRERLIREKAGDDFFFLFPF
jgi:hypothetical protein